jgi:hypothetical protein
MMFSDSVSFLSFLNKIEILIHTYTIYHQGVIRSYAGPSRIDVNSSNRRDADVNCINRNRAGECEGS